jgi:acyl-coenzyme A synthetase/AMP-(fatty) acid ligase
VLDGIGSSEAYHIYISNRPGRVRPGSTGEVVPGYEAHLGENGELSIEGDTAALLYWGEHEKTKQTFSGDTVRTGDLFERDEDGFFWYRGRVDDLIKVSGIWVAPAEIEDCLLGHPEVVECAVVGQEQNGLTVARAYVVVRTAVEESALQTFVRERLAGHKVPGLVTFVDELPKTPSGKIDRRSLRA